MPGDSFRFRSFRRQKGLLALAIVTLAAGIGAATAIYSLLSGLLIQSIAIEQPGEVRMVWGEDTAKQHPHVEISWRDFQEIQARNRTLDRMAIVSSVNLDFTLERNGHPRQVEAVTISGTFFPLLGTKPYRGRLLTEADDLPEQPARAVISNRLWRTELGRDEGVIGSKVNVSGTPVEIVGILPPAFDFPHNADLYVPIQPGGAPEGMMATIGVYIGLARPKGGVSDTAVGDDLARIGRELAALFPRENESLVFRAESFFGSIYGRLQQALWLLFGGVCILMLIACVNVGALLGGRMVQRSREFAIRAALGASRRTLIRTVVLESLALGAAATVAGVVLVQVVLRILLAAAPREIPNLANIEINPHVLLFTAGVAMAAILLVSVVPALGVLRTDPRGAMQEETGSIVASRSGALASKGLIAAEFALATILVLLATLLYQSSRQWMALDPGFDPENVLTFRITLQDPSYGPQPARRQYYARVLESLRALPGVESAGAVLLRPLSGAVGWDTRFLAEGQDPEAWKSNPVANYEAISPGYFETMRIPVLAGRDFEDGDIEGRGGVVILNESAAKRFFPGGDAVGRRIKTGRIDGNTPWATVVGVVKDVRYREWETTRVDIYIPYTQRAQHRSDFVVRTIGDPRDLAPAVERTVLAIDPRLPVSQLTTLEELVDGAFAQPRFQASVMGLFGITSLLLAGIGIFGTLLFRVLHRRRELALRAALGSSQGGISRLVLAEVLTAAAPAVACGLLGAGVIARALGTLLFGVSPLDALTYGITALGMLLCACVFALIPARVAATTRPAEVLREA